MSTGCSGFPRRLAQLATEELTWTRGFFRGNGWWKSSRDADISSIFLSCWILRIRGKKAVKKGMDKKPPRMGAICLREDG